ncbi:Hsp20/alpha crystallin family protein [Nitriliruptoraceae bacterium ZYF776]|nr:Hsp20/alpha crystallin family protein [Profundirhabdus halotolerans]
MLMRWDPFRDLDRVTASVLGDATSPVAPMDVHRHGDDLVLELDLPGVDPASIELTVDRSALTVTASRGGELDEGDTVLVRERPRGTFTRRVRLNEHLDTDALAATYDRGVLRLTVPVRESAKPRRIPVAVGADTAPVAETRDAEAA